MFKWLDRLRNRLPTVTEFNTWTPPFTPDVSYLEMQEFVPLLEFGDAQRSQPNYRLIDEHSFFEAHAFTTKEAFVMYRHANEEPTAIAFAKGRKTRNRARIRGELHMVQSKGIFALDIHRQNGIKFRRIRIPVDLPHREEMIITDPDTGHYRRFLTGLQHYKKIDAYVYLAVPEFWEPKLDGGYEFPLCTLKEPKGPKSKPFYTFSEIKT